MPHTITAWDAQFTHQFQTILMELCGTTHNFSTEYYQKTYGMADLTNYTV